MKSMIIKKHLIFLLIGFLSPASLVAEDSITTSEQLEYQRERDEIKDRRYKAQKKEEAIKEREEKCEQAYEDVEKSLEDQKEEKQKWEDKFYDFESDITDLEKKHSEEQLKTTELLEKLKKDSAQNMQDLKDKKDKELKGIDRHTANQIQSLEKALDSLNDALAKLEETRMTVFFNRRKQQNNNYSACFGQALQQTEAERSKFYAKKQRGTLRHKNLKSFVSGNKSKTKSTYNSRFQQLLNLCLNNEAAQLKKENEKKEYELTVTKLNMQEERVQKQMAKTKKKMKTLGEQSKHEKVDVLNQIKEKMQANLETFEESYDSITKKGKKRSEQILAEINKLKSRQSEMLVKRNQVVPQNKRAALVLKECQQTQQAFNLYPVQEEVLKMLKSNSSITNTSRRRNTYRRRSRSRSRGTK